MPTPSDHPIERARGGEHTQPSNDNAGQTPEWQRGTVIDRACGPVAARRAPTSPTSTAGPRLVPAGVPTTHEDPMTAEPADRADDAGLAPGAGVAAGSATSHGGPKRAR